MPTTSRSTTVSTVPISRIGPNQPHAAGPTMNAATATTASSTIRPGFERIPR